MNLHLLHTCKLGQAVTADQHCRRPLTGNLLPHVRGLLAVIAKSVAAKRLKPL